MNELATVCASLQQVDNEARNRAKTIYALCRSITPQFYKHSTEEMAASITSIQLLTQSIPEDVLATMCKLAAETYPIARRRDSKVFFDINYILGFHGDAINALRPEGYSFLVSSEKVGGKYRLGWCRSEDYDFEGNCAKPGASIWYEEI